MNWPELALFPAESVAISLTTTIWVGVLVVAFFNLRFGWTMSGLVVPGYLVPLILCKPTSAAVIFCEAVLTYWLVHTVSERPRQLPWWCSFFGRDRFLALIIGSVIVRAVLEGGVLPWLGPQINSYTGLQLDYRNDLHSYGLIIVSLMANYFWKPGLVRGMSALVTTVAITYLIVRYPLVELTNFNVGSIRHMYADISASLLASPKAYIIILTSAYVASWLNLKYSWDFNGILVPSLLALLWHDPVKVLVSFLEAGLLYVVTVGVLKTPFFRKMTVEGARRVSIVFTICFVYRLLLSHCFQRLWPEIQVTGFFGFGYLLTTLLAIKAMQQKVTVRTVKSTVQASTLGAVLGNLFGFLMTLVPMHWLSPAPARMWAAPSLAAEEKSRDLVEVVRRDKLLLYSQKTPESYFAPLAGETSHFVGGVESLTRYIRGKRAVDLDDARARFRGAHFELSIVRDRYLYLRERQPVRGWGLFVFDMKQPEGMLVEVPLPLNEWGTLESGLCLFREMKAGVLAVGGTERFTNRDRSADVLTNRGTLLAALRQALPNRGVLQVRASEQAPAQRAHGLTPFDEGRTSLWVDRRLPVGIHLKQLKSLTSGFDVRWGLTHAKNVLRDQPHDGYAELRLVRTDCRRLLAQLIAGSINASSTSVNYVEGPLNPWLINIRDNIAPRHSDLYRVARVEELMFLDEEIVQPLVRVAASPLATHSREIRESLASIAASAQILDYGVTVLHDSTRQREYFILSEHGTPTRHWGTFVFRKGLASPHVVEVPRPLLERQAFEFGVGMFEQLDAAALLLSGSHPHANHNGSSDVARLSNKASAFNLVHQAFLRDMGNRPMLVIQSRAIRSPVDADVVMATDDGTTFADLSPLKQRFLETLREQGLRVAQVNGEDSTAGYEVGILMNATSLNHAWNKELVSLWLSPTLRGRYVPTKENLQIESQLDVLDISAVSTDLIAYLQSQPTRRGHREVPAEFRRAVDVYLQNRDVIRLSNLIGQYPDYKFARVDDRSTGQILLLVEPGPDELPWAINVSGYVGSSHRTATVSIADQSAIREYLDSRFAWLELVGDTP